MDKTKPTHGVFINVVKDVEEFLSGEHSFYFDSYKELFARIKDSIDELAYLEELILQGRSLTDKNLNDIKLSTLREYVYARCPFYRSDKATKDIRVLVDRIDEIYPNHKNPSLDKLYHDTQFMETAKSKLIEAMKEDFEKKSADYWKILVSLQITK